MEIFIAIIAIVVGVLQIVLFFKIWVMTNDVKKIKGKNGCRHRNRSYR